MGEWNVANNRNTILPGDLFNPLSLIKLALGNHLGGGFAPLLIAQGDGNMIGVGDNNIGLGDLGDCHLLGEFTVQALSLCLMLGVALALFILALDLLFRHPQPLTMAPPLIAVVGNS